MREAAIVTGSVLAIATTICMQMHAAAADNHQMTFSAILTEEDSHDGSTAGHEQLHTAVITEDWHVQRLY